MTVPSPLLEARGLTMEYARGGRMIRVLDQVDLEVFAGERVAVTGPSGSGKSTLLGLLAGLDRPSSGTVRIEGTDLSELDEAGLAALRGRRLGFVFQSFRLLPTLTAMENVRVPLELAGAADAPGRAAKWLARVGLSDRAGHRPGELSGGEQQRVAIARALVTRPALLLADEPTGNLDTTSGDSMTALLDELVEEVGAALVMVTHDERLAGRAGRRVDLRDGRVVGDERGESG